MKEHDTDREIREELNKRTMHKEDVDRHTLNHKRDRDLQHIKHMTDEGY